MINNTINPILASLGPFQIRYYGLIYALGFILSFFALNYFRKKGILKVSEDKLYDLVLYIIAGDIIGARLFHVLFWDFSYYLTHPLQILAFWNGGLSFHGGLLGIIVGAYLFSKRNNLKFLLIADILAIPAVLGVALGRLANFANHEIYGIVSDLPFCINDSVIEGCRHPYQIYSFIKRMGVFAWLFYLISIKESKKILDGFVFWNSILLMNLGRFILDFWRDDIIYYGLVAGQWLSVVAVLISLVVLIKYYKNSFKNLLSI